MPPEEKRVGSVINQSLCDLNQKQKGKAVALDSALWTEYTLGPDVNPC
jgi:hypothetical protein